MESEAELFTLLVRARSGTVLLNNFINPVSPLVKKSIRNTWMSQMTVGSFAPSDFYALNLLVFRRYRLPFCLSFILMKPSSLTCNKPSKTAMFLQVIPRNSSSSPSLCPQLNLPTCHWYTPQILQNPVTQQFCKHHDIFRVLVSSLQGICAYPLLLLLLLRCRRRQ